MNSAKDASPFSSAPLPDSIAGHSDIGKSLNSSIYSPIRAASDDALEAEQEEPEDDVDDLEEKEDEDDYEDDDVEDEEDDDDKVIIEDDDEEEEEPEDDDEDEEDDDDTDEGEPGSGKKIMMISIPSLLRHSPVVRPQ